MKWGGSMNLLRMARFNIRKHKAASVSLMILICLCQLFSSLALHNLSDNSSLFHKKAKEMQAIQNFFCVERGLYKSEYEGILKNDSRVSRVVSQDSVLLWENIIKLKNGQEYMCNSLFLNGEEKNSLENITLSSHLSEEELASIPHPIYAPYVIREYYGFNEGDSFNITYHQKEYTFTIVGFYETTILATGNMGGIKYIISDEDYKKFASQCGEHKILGYDVFNLEDCEAVLSDFTKQARQMADTGKSFNITFSVTYNMVSSVASMFLVLLAYLLLLFAVILIITIFVMIRNRIANNIEEQMTNIGTMGALGYTSKQVIGMYILEYGILAIIGGVLGIIGAECLAPVLNQFGFMMLGLKSADKIAFGIDGIMLVGVAALVSLISFSEARKIKKYPPVVAFRKGVDNHHFKHNYFALEKTRHLFQMRLAGKRTLSAIKQNVIIAICVCVATIAMMFSVILYGCCGEDQNGIKKMTGFEMCDVAIDITHSIQAEQFKNALLQRPEVRKVNLTHTFINVSLKELDVLAVVYPDYNEVENINPYEGRMPIFDNEIGITGALARNLGKEIGDYIEVQYGDYCGKYLITGVTQSMINNGQTLYFTEESIKMIYPSYQSDELGVYFNEGVDKKEFIASIKSEYGQSVEDMKKQLADASMSQGERIKAKAEAKIASLMSIYGIDSMDYAIMVDGKLIKGSSKNFGIYNIRDMEEYVETNIGAYIQGINWGCKMIILVSALVVIIIITMLIKANITRQRMEFGVYKAMGYTTAQLMLQTAMSLMPTVFVGVILGIGIAIWGSPNILSCAFSVIGITHMLIDVSVMDVVSLTVAILGLSFVTTLVSAYKIKQISVYELLTE